MTSAPGCLFLIWLVAHGPHQVFHVFWQQSIDSSNVSVQEMEVTSADVNFLASANEYLMICSIYIHEIATQSLFTNLIEKAEVD